MVERSPTTMPSLEAIPKDECTRPKKTKKKSVAPVSSLRPISILRAPTTKKKQTLVDYAKFKGILTSRKRYNHGFFTSYSSTRSHHMLRGNRKHAPLGIRGSDAITGKQEQFTQPRQLNHRSVDEDEKYLQSLKGMREKLDAEQANDRISPVQFKLRKGQKRPRLQRNSTSSGRSVYERANSFSTPVVAVRSYNVVLDQTTGNRSVTPKKETPSIKRNMSELEKCRRSTILKRNSSFRNKKINNINMNDTSESTESFGQMAVEDALLANGSSLLDQTVLPTTAIGGTQQEQQQQPLPQQEKGQPQHTASVIPPTAAPTTTTDAASTTLNKWAHESSQTHAAYLGTPKHNHHHQDRAPPPVLQKYFWKLQQEQDEREQAAAAVAAEATALAAARQHCQEHKQRLQQQQYKQQDKQQQQHNQQQQQQQQQQHKPSSSTLDSHSINKNHTDCPELDQSPTTPTLSFSERKKLWSSAAIRQRRPTQSRQEINTNNSSGSGSGSTTTANKTNNKANVPSITSVKSTTTKAATQRPWTEEKTSISAAPAPHHCTKNVAGLPSVSSEGFLALTKDDTPETQTPDDTIKKMVPVRATSVSLWPPLRSAVKTTTAISTTTTPTTTAVAAAVAAITELNKSNPNKIRGPSATPLATIPKPGLPTPSPTTAAVAAGAEAITASNQSVPAKIRGYSATRLAAIPTLGLPTPPPTTTAVAPGTAAITESKQSIPSRFEGLLSHRWPRFPHPPSQHRPPRRQQ